MIDKLTELLPQISEWLVADLESGDFSRWDSLIINKRKPHTYRVFTMVGDLRVCLHRFEPCGPLECFKHPHPWPAAFLVLDGNYRHWIGHSPTMDGEPLKVYEEILAPGTMYEITERQTWHSVQPLNMTYTIMVNGPPWEEQHSQTRTTKGKDLDKMDEEELKAHLDKISRLLDWRNGFVRCFKPRGTFSYIGDAPSGVHPPFRRSYVRGKPSDE
jgi:hypothetical protein